MKLKLLSKAGRAKLYAATLGMNYSAHMNRGIIKDSVPHHDAAPGHLKHLEAVKAEAAAKRERRNRAA